MAIGLKLQISDSRTGTTETRVFGHFPVRIGRNPLNDLKLLPGFVSQFHAVLELRGESLWLRDLGSKNGTTMPTGRAPAHEPVDLSQCDGQFGISALAFRAVVEDIGDVAPVRTPRRGLLLGGLGAEKAQLAETMLADPTQMSFVVAEPAVAPVEPPAKLGEGTGPLRSQINAYKASRATVGRVLQTLASEVTSLPAHQQQELLAWTRENFPNIAEEPEFKRLVEHHGVALDTKDVSAQGRRLEYVALQAVRELSSLYTPRSAIGTEAELVEFLTRVRDTLDMFFKTFIPLRDGYRQFKSEMDIRDTTPYHASPAGRATTAVRRAKTPQALAELLLGVADDQLAAHKAVEGTFADLMIHQLALLSGVMRGVHSLMQELSPTALEAGLDERRRKGETGWMFGPYRFRELWTVYLSRHGDLTESEKQLYSHVFGNDFARAYAQLSGEASAQTADGASPAQTEPQ